MVKVTNAELAGAQAGGTETGPSLSTVIGLSYDDDSDMRTRCRTVMPRGAIEAEASS